MRARPRGLRSHSRAQAGVRSPMPLRACASCEASGGKHPMRIEGKTCRRPRKPIFNLIFRRRCLPPDPRRYKRIEPVLHDASDLVSLKRRSSPHSSSASALPRLGLGISLDHDIDHGALEDLTRRALGKLFPNLDVLWNFEACDPVFTKVLERLRTGIGARLQADHRLDAVAPHLVRDAEHRDLMDGWMLG